MDLYAIGLGCDRGTPADTVHTALLNALAELGADIRQVMAVASIDLKADEAALLTLAGQYGWSMRFYRAAELAEVPVPNPSEVVAKYTGTPSVSEAAALRVGAEYLSGLSSANTENSLQALPYMDMSFLVIEKYKWRGADGKNATVSIARLPMPHSVPMAATPA